MYFELYQILSDFIYGAGVELSGYMDMTLTVLSTIGVLFVFAIPFAISGNDITSGITPSFSYLLTA